MGLYEIWLILAGSSRIAMRENGTLTWLLSDNLGSTSTTADASGSLLDLVKYTAFGEMRDGKSVCTVSFWRSPRFFFAGEHSGRVWNPPLRINFCGFCEVRGNNAHQRTIRG